MKLKYDLNIVEIVGEKVAIPAAKRNDAFHGVLRVNEVAVDILQLLRSDTTEEAMTDTLLTMYKAGRE